MPKAAWSRMPTGGAVKGMGAMRYYVPDAVAPPEPCPYAAPARRRRHRELETFFVEGLRMGKIGAGLVWGWRISLLVVGLSSGVAAAQRPGDAYDGRWWLSAHWTQEFQFVSGYADCSIYDDKTAPSVPDLSLHDLSEEITAFYQHNPGSQNVPVPDLIERKIRNTKKQINNQYVEMIGGNHGVYDGLYWRQIDTEFSSPRSDRNGIISREGRTAYIAGYLACHVREGHDRGGFLSRPIDDYVTLIDRWYGLDLKTGSVDPDREMTSIADVLARFRD
jgi:hypothetical protein